MRSVHRDVSPENILVGTDGYPRVLDFGVARAVGKQSTTQDGAVKGKIAYMAPEQILGDPLDQRTDVFSASAVLWQALTGHRLWQADNFVELAHKVLNAQIEAPSKVAADAPKKLDAIVLRGLEREVDRRWRTAGAMAEALEAAGGLATHREVGLWVRRLGTGPLRELAAKVAKLDNKALTSRATVKAGAPPPRGQARAEARLVEVAQAPAHGGEPTDTSAVVSADADTPPASVGASATRSAPARRGGFPRWALGAGAITLAVGAGLLGLALRGSSAATDGAGAPATGIAPSSGTSTSGTASGTDGSRRAPSSTAPSATTTVSSTPSAAAPTTTATVQSSPAPLPPGHVPTGPMPKPKPTASVNPLYQMD
jgi:serine/threonine-protein kinase